VKQRDQLLLGFCTQVDQQVAATQDIELREGRVHDEILRGKDHQLTNLFAHLVAAFGLREEPPKSWLGDIGGDILQVNALARSVDRIRVQVGGEDLHSELPLGVDGLRRLQKHDGQRIGLLSGGTTRHPSSKRLSGRAVGEQGWQGSIPQIIPGSGITEELGHPDQQFTEEEIEFLWVLLQVADVVRELVDLMNPHSALDPAMKRVLLVKGKVMARVGAQQNHRLLQGTLGLIFQGHCLAGEEWSVLAQPDDTAGQLGYRSHDVRQPGVHRAARHAVELGRRRVLNQHHARLLLDGAQAQRAVRAHARQDHADALLLLVLSQGAKEEINGQAQPSRGRRFEQMQDAVQDGHVFVRWDHIHAIRAHTGAIFYLPDFHAGGPLQQFGHDPLVRRIQVLNDDKGQTAACRRLPEELFQSFEASRRGADADDRAGDAAHRGRDSPASTRSHTARLGFRSGFSIHSSVFRACQS